jgi:hypothetical protein
MSDLGFEELAAGRYEGIIDRVRYSFRTTTQIIITYKLETPGGTRRLEERMLIDAPQSSVSYFFRTAGLARVEDILRINGKSLADADGLKSLPGLLEGTAVGVVTRNQRLHGYNCPIVVRVEKR